jgi:membrane protease YdiL (CAAX protease family)
MEPKVELNKIQVRNESIGVVIYFTLYFTYLFFHLESEIGHWLSLVLIPFLALTVYHRQVNTPFQNTLASFGIRKDNWTTGLGWALMLGLFVSVMQLFISGNATSFWEVVESGKAFYLFPIAFLFLLFSAGFTEEFFFRGVLQTRLARYTGNKIVAVLFTSILFSLYHLPYTYLNPNWPSHGDLAAAFTAAFTNGMLGGIILGVVYEQTDRNLFASILVHSLINVFPAMTLIKFQA